MKPYFEDDLVTLYHGDALEVTEWLSADVLVTDPPYGISWNGGAGTLKNGKFVRRDSNPIAGDNTLEARERVLLLWADKPGIVFGTWRMPKPEKTQHRLIWHKKGQAPGPTNAPFLSQDEEIYILGKGFVSSSPPMRSVIGTGESRPTEIVRIGHPTPKPVGLMEMLIERCQPEWVVADPFAGSGATLVAARNLGRKVIGVELEEKYCELIANRLSQQVFDFGSLEA
ncbi:site-specific DNA-methyltransferase [bacterium]|nr:site-specific DNA-methyltransferase [bacterium]